jgi:hypothetical protein
MTLRLFMVTALVTVSGVGGSGGCQEPTGLRTIANPDPAVKIPAIKQAVDDHDRKQAAAMIENLEDDDPAVRLFAIQGLHRLTGQDFGYLYYASVEERAPAVEKWKQWLRDQSDH